MKKITVLGFCLFLFLSTVSSAFAAEMIFIEAEKIRIDSMITKDNDGAYNGKVLTSTAKDQKATIEFEVKEGGKYTVWFRAYHTGQSDNSFFYSMDGEKDSWLFDLYDDLAEALNFNKWYWWKLNYRDGDKFYNKKEYDLKPGKHTLELTAREPGALLDKIIITNDLTYDPSTISGDPEAVYKKTATTATINNPKTGDTGIILYIITAAAALAALTALVLFRKKMKVAR